MKISNRGVVDPFTIEPEPFARVDPLEAEEPTLESLARAYRELDEQEKAAKKAKEKLRGPFFALMTQRIREEVPLARQVIDVPAEEVARFDNDPRQYALFYYPTFTVENIAFDGEVWKLVLQENPELVGIDFQVDGYKLGRSISLVGAEFKAQEFDEWLGSPEAEALFDETTLDALCLCVDVHEQPVWVFDEEAARELIAANPETLAVFQRFSYAGKPQVKFLPVSKAKTEQEDDGQAG